MKKGEKRPNWIPVISSLCFLFLLFVGGTLVSPAVGGALVGTVILVVGTFSAAFPDHYKQVLSVWTDSILNETHVILIAFFLLTGIALVALFLNSFHLKISIERNKINP